jgi:hypothetical protein
MLMLLWAVSKARTVVIYHSHLGFTREASSTENILPLLLELFRLENEFLMT